MTLFSSFQREDIVNRLKEGPLDILVIGGGITGAGIALDASTRGLRTGLVEMQDFSAGTSSRSTKLIHGGLRYLKQLDIKVVAEVGKERTIVYENGPHITTPEWMMLPFYKGGNFGALTTNIGLRLYDFLAGVKKNERRKILTTHEALQKEPLLKKKNLLGAGYYVEYKTDDARLTIEVLKKAVQYGAHAINYSRVIDFIYNKSNQMIGVVVENQINQETYEIYAKKIINAAGPWVDVLRDIDGHKEGKTLHITKGVHLVLSNKTFPLQQAIYFDAPDGRMIFAIPRNNKTYVGTTETNYDDDLETPTITKADQSYLIGSIVNMFPTLKITTEDIQSSWAGLRPLIAEKGKKPGDISRKDEIIISSSGLISIAGGKLTGYRKMAEEVVDRIVNDLKVDKGILYSNSETKYMPISGGDVGGSKGFKRFMKIKLKEGINLGINENAVLMLIQRYGTNVDYIFRKYHVFKDQREGIDPLVLAELSYSIKYELVYKPIDFFIRRTGTLYFNIDWVHKHKKSVINYMAKILNWNEKQVKSYAQELDHSLAYATVIKK